MIYSDKSLDELNINKNNDNWDMAKLIYITNLNEALSQYNSEIVKLNGEFNLKDKNE